jgi:hypothetical protein
MYLDYRRLREEQLMRQSGPPCACGQRLWSRQRVRDSERRRFKCNACLTVLDVPAELFHKQERQDGKGQPSVGQAEEPDHHQQQT